MGRKHQFVAIPHAVLDHADLTAYELLVYISLLRFRNPNTGTCFPGLQTIADTARISKRTVIRTIDQLEQKGVLSVKRAKAVGSQTNESNLYTVRIMSDDPTSYYGASSKGLRVPKRHKSSDSESLRTTADEPGSDSESLGSDSESLGVVTQSHPKKINVKKINEEDMTQVFRENPFDENSFIDTAEPVATEKQINYIRDLAMILSHGAGNGIPNDLHVARWRKLTQSEATNQIHRYLKAIGRPDEIVYPQHGDHAYEALSEAGKAFADSAGDPSSVLVSNFVAQEVTA